MQANTGNKMNEIQTIQSKIYEIRGQRVMLDRDLAAMYGVETKVLNQAVKRNIKRFEGDDFMFRLTKDEATHVALRAQNVTLETPLYTGDSQNLTRLRSQNVTSNIGRGGARYLPYAFTELGVAMLRNCYQCESRNHACLRGVPSFGNIITHSQYCSRRSSATQGLRRLETGH